MWANRRAIRHLAASHQRRKQLEAEAAAEERAREQWKMARFGAIRSRIAAIMVRRRSLVIAVGGPLEPIQS